jgi:hypothetical protein
VNTRTTCTWTQADPWDMPGAYETSCENMFQIMEGDPADNDFRYCCYCGGELVVVKAVIDEVSE